MHIARRRQGNAVERVLQFRRNGIASRRRLSTAYLPFAVPSAIRDPLAELTRGVFPLGDIF